MVTSVKGHAMQFRSAYLSVKVLPNELKGVVERSHGCEVYVGIRLLLARALNDCGEDFIRATT